MADKIQVIIDMASTLKRIKDAIPYLPQENHGTRVIKNSLTILGAELSKPKDTDGPNICLWTRAFDNHFNISCYSGERANGNFKGMDAGAKWEFKYCPYCGRKIEVQKIDG